jgi:hypothetical protein
MKHPGHTYGGTVPAISEQGMTALWPLPGSKASQAAIRKRKAEVSKKSAAKKAKASPSKTLLLRSVTPPPKLGPTTNIVKVAQCNTHFLHHKIFVKLEVH